MYLKRGKNFAFKGMFYFKYLNMLFLFLSTAILYINAENASKAEDPLIISPPEIQAVTLVKEKTDELILQHFLLQIAQYALGEYQTDFLKNEKAFNVFISNYKYNSERLITEIPLKISPNINSIIQATLNALQPYIKSAVFTPAEEYFLFCKTIRGPRILSFTKKPLVNVSYQNKYKNWNLSILSPQSLARNILYEPQYLNAVMNTTDFVSLLTNEMPNLRSKYFLNFKSLNTLFFERIPLNGYDVSNITREIKFFSSLQNNQRELCFLSLPILQYTSDNNRLFDFFFVEKDVPLIQKIKELLGNEDKSDTVKLLVDRITEYLNAAKIKQFNSKTFEEKIQNLFDEMEYSINYDAIVSNKKNEVYGNLETFLLSNGISGFDQLKKNREFIEKIIEKFFVLGTTYFYRSWMTIGDFTNYLDDIKSNALNEKRPIKIKVFACSTGEECLTFAFALLDKGIENFTILGSDINSKFIETAKMMIYPQQSFERLPDYIRINILKKYFIKVPGGYEIKDKNFFSKRIFYRVMDITKPLPSDLASDIAPPYDIISCQNIFLYLNPAIIPNLYNSLLSIINIDGLFILVDKYYDHFSLYNKSPAPRRLLNINKYIAKAFSKEIPDDRLLELLKKINKRNYTFESIRQFYETSKISLPEKRSWLESFLNDAGNHEIIITLACHNLIAMEAYDEAAVMLKDCIYKFPYLLDNYLILREAEKKLKHQNIVDYFTFIIKAIDLLYKTDSTEAIQQALSLFKRALSNDPKELLGYYILGYQLIHYAANLIKNEALLVDYEIFFNQAFKNLNYVRIKQPDNVYALRGMAEIAYALYSPYSKSQNQEIADRLIYNALIRLEPAAVKSKEFTIMYTLGKLQLKMGSAYLSMQLTESAYATILKTISSFNYAETLLKNYSHVLIYNYYVDYAEAWVVLSRVLKKLPSNVPSKYDKDQCIYYALKNIDTALSYNSVYGIEAVELRNQIFEENEELKRKYEDSFNC